MARFMRPGNFTWGLNDAVRRGWLVFLPFAFVPVVGWVGSLPSTPVAAVVPLALIAWALTIFNARSTTSGVALLARAGHPARMGAWEWSLLAFVLAVCVAYLVTGTRIRGITYNDGAYYYGVARHMAATRRFEEPIVWHFLHPPDRIVHAPFDYWGAATALLLAPSLAVFGDTPRTANLTMSVVSAGALVAFWYLVCRAMPLRYSAAQVIAVVIFALSASLDVYRFQPESITLTHLWLLLALIAFRRRRFASAILCCFAMLLTRGDAIVLSALISLAALGEEWRAGGGPRRIARLAGIGFACVAIYALWSFVSFGTLTPPGSRAVPFLPNYWQVFDYVGADQRTWMPFSHRFTFAYLTTQLGMALRALRTIPFAPAMDWWLALAMVPALMRFRGRPPIEPLIWLCCFGGYVLLAWVSGSGFARVRAPFVFAPLVVLAGALGIDAVLAVLDAWVQRGASPRLRALVAGAAVFALCAVFVGTLPLLRGWNKAANLPQQGELPQLDAVLGGEPVASNVPWYMISHTRSPAVSIPFNGEAAIEAVLNRYQVRWLVFYDPHSGQSSAVLASILSGTRTQLGQLRFERVPVEGVKAALYRITSTPAA